MRFYQQQVRPRVVHARQLEAQDTTEDLIAGNQQTPHLQADMSTSLHISHADSRGSRSC